MKKEKFDYFDNFVKSFSSAVASSKILKELVLDYDKSKVNEFKLKIHSLEVLADRNKYEISKQLIKDFLPPIEREDILVLTQRIDNVVDNIDEVIINIDILNVYKLKPVTKDFIELLCKACDSTQKILEDFKARKKYDIINSNIIVVNNLEAQADNLYQSSMKKLYTNEQENPIDALEVIKWTRLYDGFENCLDACEAVANCINDILLKNS